jgi:hypothetical protein
LSLRAASLLATVTALLVAPAAAAAVFTPDPAFNGSGVVSSRGNAGVVATPDGGVWIASWTGFVSGDLVIERRKADGSLDPSWGSLGTVTFSGTMRPIAEGLNPAVVPNADGGLDVAFIPSSRPAAMWIRRLDGTGAQNYARNFGLTCAAAGVDCFAPEWKQTSLMVPDGDGLAMAYRGESSVRLVRVAPGGAWTDQPIAELPSNKPAGLTRLADGTLVVVAGDPEGDKVFRLAARTAAGAPVTAYDATPALGFVPFAGLGTTSGGRLVTGGDTGGATAGAVVEGRDPATGALDPGFGTAGRLTLPTLGAMPIIHRTTAIARFGDGLVVNSLEGDLVDGSAVLGQSLTLTSAGGTVLAGPRSIGSYAFSPTFAGLPPAVTPDLGRVYVVRTDADSPTTANVVALKTKDEPAAPPPAVPPPTTTPTTPTTGTTPATPTPPTPPPGPAPVKVTVTKLTAAKGGTVKLTVRAAAAGDLVLTAAAKAGRTSLRWGPVAASFRTAGTRTVTLRPSAAVRRALTKRGAKLRATLTVRFVPTSGARVQLTRTTTLRGPR